MSSVSVTVPGRLRVNAVGQTSVVLAWDRSIDEAPSSIRYRIYRNGAKALTTTRTTATLTGLRCGTSYTVAVDAVSSSGNVSGQARVVTPTAPCPDTSAPSAPPSLRQTATGSTSVTVGWAAATDDRGVVGYGVYVDGILVSSVPTLSYSVGGLSCGTSRAVAVDAVDLAGNRSAKATAFVATSSCPDTQPPTAPGSARVTQTGVDALHIAWDPSSDDRGVASYEVTVSGRPPATTGGTTFVATALSCGTSYDATIVAVDGAGNRSPNARARGTTSNCPSSPPQPDTKAPTQPGNLAVTSATASSVALSWSASTDDTGVRGYGLYRDATLAATVTQPSSMLSGLSCGNTYSVSVDAYDAAGNRSARTTVAAATAACGDTSAPSAPSLTGTSSTETSVTLSWAASTDNVGVTGYDVLNGSTLAGSPAQTSFTSNGLACGKSYTFGVRARDAAGNLSAVTTTMVSTLSCPDTTPPPAPGAPSAGSVGQTSIGVAWSPSSGATGYGVYLNGTRIGSTPGASYSFDSLTCGTTYTIGVDAYDAAGNRSATVTTSVTTAGCPPPAAGGCTTTIGSGLASVIQSASAGATICLAAGSYGNVSLVSIGKSAGVTVRPVAGADVVIGTLSLRMVSNLRFTGTGGSMKIGGLDLDGPDGDPSWSHHLTFDHATWTAGAIVRTHGANQAILFDANVFDNLPTPLYEGRVTVRGYNNTEPVGVTISNSHFGGGCSDGIQVIGNAYAVEIGPGNEFTGIKQSGCGSVHADPIQFYGARNTIVTGNYFHDNGDGTGGLASFDGDDYTTVTDNVFVCTCVYPWPAAAFGAQGWVVEHNTFAGGGALRFQNGNSGEAPSGNVVRNNVWAGGGLSASTSGYGTNDHNLNSGLSGTGNLTGTPIFVGGSTPTTFAGYRLASGSPGKGAASDGTDIGIG